MKYKDDILLILPKLSNKAKLNDLFNVYVILFNKLQQLGMKPEDFSSEVGILILDNSGISNTDESTNMLIQQISSIKIKQAFNAVFNSINEIHEDNITHIKEDIKTEIEDVIELNPEDFKDMEIDQNFENKLNNI